MRRDTPFTKWPVGRKRFFTDIIGGGGGSVTPITPSRSIPGPRTLHAEVMANVVASGVTCLMVKTTEMLAWLAGRVPCLIPLPKIIFFEAMSVGPTAAHC